MSQAGQEFDHIAKDYDRHRPEYPDELMRALCAYIEAGAQSPRATIVDVGAGTGIATRMLRRYLPPTYRVVGLEPGEGMRQTALEATDPEQEITYIESTAESMPFEDGALAGVVVAQALQWFDRPRFYAEAVRVLAPCGTLAILQNNRNWRESAFLDAYETLLETNDPTYSRHYRSFDIESELRAVPDLNVDPPQFVDWDRAMTVEQFIGMALSSSRVQHMIGLVGEERAVPEIRQLATSATEPDGTLLVRYRSELYLARRRK